MIHSKIIIHWTGGGDGDFDNIEKVKDINNKIRTKYVERLIDDCKDGFYMKPGTEEIYGVNGHGIKATISRVCFSEIRLSQVQRHAKKFGKLGIGVHRDFVIEREGNPVFYVQNGDQSAVVENFCSLLSFVKKYENLTNGNPLESLETILGYLKGMSDRNKAGLEYYEEMEWRIVHMDKYMGKYFSKKDEGEHIYRVDIAPNELKIIIFPDNRTKERALHKPFLNQFFGSDWPMLTTLEDCKNF